MPYRMEIIHRNKKITEDHNESIKLKYSIGHFAVCLKERNDDGICIGKYPSGNIIWSAANLDPDKEKNYIRELNAKSHKDKYQYTNTKTLKLSQIQYEKALKYIESSIKCGDATPEEMAGNKEKCNVSQQYYIMGLYDCVSFVQDIYHAAGLPLYFTLSYTQQELQDLGSVAAVRAIMEYSSIDDISKKLRAISADNKEEVAMMLNIDTQNVKTSSKFLHCIKQNTFSVKIDDNLLESIKELVDTGSTSTLQASGIIKSTQGMIEEIHALFVGFKIPPEETVRFNTSNKASTSQELAISQDITSKEIPQFIELKQSIIALLGKSRVDFDEILERIHMSSPSKSPSGKTQEAILAEYKIKITELQIKSKTIFDEAQKNPSKYKYELGETIAGMAYHNREEMRINKWLSDQLSQVSGGIESGNTIQAEEKEKHAIKAWNKEIENLSAKRIFHEDIEQSIAQVNITGEIIAHEMDMFLQGVDKEMFL